MSDCCRGAPTRDCMAGRVDGGPPRNVAAGWTTFATAVGAGLRKRVVPLFDNAGLHTRPNLDVSDGIRLVCPPPDSPELQPVKTLWPLVDETIVYRLVPSLHALVADIARRCCDLAERQSEISSRTTFAWWPNNRAPIHPDEVP